MSPTTPPPRTERRSTKTSGVEDGGVGVGHEDLGAGPGQTGEASRAQHGAAVAAGDDAPQHAGAEIEQAQACVQGTPQTQIDP
jgi:hypothetical protein